MGLSYNVSIPLQGSLAACGRDLTCAPRVTL